MKRSSPYLKNTFTHFYTYYSYFVTHILMNNNGQSRYGANVIHFRDVKRPLGKIFMFFYAIFLFILPRPVSLQFTEFQTPNHVTRY